MRKLFAIIIAIGMLAFQSCKEQVCDGYVVSKHYTPAHVSFHPVFNGKVTTLIPIKHPDKWKIVFENNGRKRCVGVTNDLYDKAQVGDSVHVENKNIKLYRRTCKEEIF